MAEIARVIAAAKSKIGARYVWAATGPDTFDCSGLTMWAWKQAGVDIPRTSQMQAKFGKPVALKDIQMGDLVTSNWGSGTSSHVALYIGGGKVIHAPRPGSTVRVANLDANYRSKINAIRRVPGGKTPPGGTNVDFDWGDIPSPGDLLDAGGSLADVLLGEGGILGPVKSMAAASTQMAAGFLRIGELATWVLKLALPSTWVRIASGLLGVMFLFLGMAFLIRETRTT